MGKKRSFLGFLVTLFMVFATANSFAAGYTCPDQQQYTECNSGYFMIHRNLLEDCLLNLPTCEWNGTVQVNNYCLSCQSAPNGAVACPGGTDAPVYEISLYTSGSALWSTLLYSYSAGFCTGNATECKASGSTRITKIPDLPKKSGYVFTGFYTNGTQVADKTGKILVDAATLSGPQEWYAQFTSCRAGYYCDGSSPTAQEECPAGKYCPMNSSEPTSCPDGWTSDSGATSKEKCYKTFTLNKNGASFTEWSDQYSQYVTVTNTSDTGDATIKVYNNSNARFGIPQGYSEPDYYTLTGGVGDSDDCTDSNPAILDIVTDMTAGETLYLCKTPNTITISYDMNNQTGGETPANVKCDADNTRCMTDAIKPASSAIWQGQEFANSWSCTTSTGSQCGDNDVVSDDISTLKDLVKSGSATVTLKANTMPCDVGYYCPPDAPKTACPYGWISSSMILNTEEGTLTYEEGADNIEDCYVDLLISSAHPVSYEFVWPDNQVPNSQGHACQQDGSGYRIYMNAPCKLPDDKVTSTGVVHTTFNTTGYWGFRPLTADGEIDHSIYPTSEKAFKTITLTVDSDAKTKLDGSGYLFNDIFGENPDGATTQPEDEDAVVPEKKYLFVTPVLEITCGPGTYLPAGSSNCQSCTHTNLAAGAGYCPGGTFEFSTVYNQGIESCSNLAGIPNNVTGSYSIVRDIQNQTAQTCRFTVDDITTVNGCTISGNTIAYDGTSWGTDYYTVTPEDGYHAVDENTTNPTCALNTLTINYNTNGATGGTPDATSQTCEYGADCMVAGRGTMEKTNMVFQGWDYNTDHFIPGTNINNLVTDLVKAQNATIELVANWQTPKCLATNGTATLSSVTDNKPVCTITCDSGYTQGGASNTITEFTVTGNSGDTSVSGECNISIFTCTSGKTDDNKTCPAGKYCPGGTVQYGTQDSNTGCARPCPTDENGGSVSSASGSEDVSACKTTRTNIELKDGNTITGRGTTICSYNNTSKKYDAGCNTTVDSCVARYFYEGSSAICIPTELGHYSPDGDKQQYSCQDLIGGNDTTNTADRGSIVTDCFNTCAQIDETENHLTKIPVANKVNASANGEIAACSYTVQCDAGYNNTQDANTCKPNTIVVGLDDNNDGTAESTVYLQYAGSWYKDSDLKAIITSIALPLSEAQTCYGYEYQGTQIVDSDGKFRTDANTFVTSGPVTITATWDDKPTVTCQPGQYYTGTGTSCTPCKGGSYCSGGTFYQNEGERGIEECPSAATTGTIPATNSNGESLPMTISSDENASSISQCYATNVAYKSTSQRATGGQTCYYSNGKYDSNCKNQTVYVCTGGYYLQNSTESDCVAVGYGYFSVSPTEREKCPSADDIDGTTETEISTSIAQCYTEGVWYEPDVNTGLRRTCYHTTADATTQGYITQCAIQNIVACNAGYYDDGVATRTNPDTGELDRICAVVPQNKYSTGIPATDYEGSSRPTAANETTLAFDCPDNGVTDNDGATSAKMCYKTDADCSGAVANATTATGTCYYSADKASSSARYNVCDASQCTVSACDTNYIVNSSANGCVVDPSTCPAGSYCDDEGTHSCPPSHPESQPGSTSINDCYKPCETPCVEPESCPNLLNKCKYNTSTTFSGRQYYGNTECIVTSDAQCKLDFNTDSSNKCIVGYYMFSNTDPYCKACNTLNGWIGSTMYPQTYNPTLNRGPTACYASVEPSCNFANSPLLDTDGIPTGEYKNYCPENATCTEGVKPDAAYVWYPSNIGIPSSFCKLNYTCNPGYVSNSTGPVDYWYKKSTTTGRLSTATITAACNPDTFAITLDDTGGTGGAGTIYQTYKTGWFADSNGTTQLSTPLPIPTIQYWTFSGYYEAPVGGNNNTQVIDANGNFVNNDPTASSKYTVDTTLYAWWERNETECQSGQYYTGTDAVHDVCEKNTYCTGNGTTNMGAPGCFATCPDGGLTDTTGSKAITDCYKIYNEGDTDADGKVFDIPNGTGSKKCYFVGDETSGKYGRCTTTITSCSAGYYVSTDATGTCSKVGSGQYSPEGDTAIYNCATNGKYTLGSNDPYGEQTDCYTICDTAIPTVSFSESVAVAPDSETKGSNANGIYDACLYNVVCKTGYDNTNGATPACNAHKYTITLDYNGGTGEIANTVQCTFDSGICELPDTATLTKTGYVPVKLWCTRPDGNGECYTAGQNTATNISADASDITLYAQWTPGIFKITLSTPSVDGLTPENNVQGPVYLKYESGWFADANARTELGNITELGTSLPELTGYNFGGYALNGTTIIVDGSGAMQSSALTVVSDSTQTATAIWGVGKITCQPGTYYSGTGNECTICTQGWYCDKETTVATNSGEAGRTQCPQNGTTATTGANTASLCYKTGMEYITKFDNNQPRAKGTQTCFFETIGYTNCNYSGFERSVNINWCAGGYWHESGIDCVAVGANYFSPVAELNKTQCPDNGNTNGATTSDSITDCIKEMPYESGTKNARGTCDRSADENGTYNSACIDNSIEITWCAGGHWYDATQSKTDCVAVGANHFSPVADMTKYPCPNNGTTSLTTAETPVNVCSRSVPYPGANYNGPEVNGSGIQSCYYAGDEMAQYDGGYINNCGTIVIKQCNTGYYWPKTEDSNSTETICKPVSVGYYGPVTTQNSTNQTSRAQCPMDAETGVRGTTETALSGDASACYVTNKTCTSNGATGKTTCNYNDADKDYNDCDAYECVLEGCPAGTQLNPQNNTCDECDEGSYCVGGNQPAASCADAGDRYTMSYAGATSGGQCYDNCQIADIAHASTVKGIIYRNGDSTCAATSCDTGYYVANGKCVECPAGSYCDPDVENGEPQSCPSTHPNSDPTQATSQDMCYAECTTDDLANSTSVAGKNYYGASVADTCVAITCDAGYYVENGKCVECPAGSYCDPDVENGEPQTCPNGYTSDTGSAYNQDMCYQNCTTDDISNSIAVNGKDFYGASIADTCVATTCEAGYYVENGKCVECASGSYCDPDVENGEPQTCPSTHPNSDTTQATSQDMCYAECTTDDLANSTSVAGKNYYGASVADTCVAITCDAGYYVENGKCVECPAGSYCDTNKNDGKPIKCPTSHPNASAQSTSVYECYVACPRIDNASEQIERDYYDDMGQNTCRATTCQDGYYLTADGLCLACAENKYCDANGVHDCPATHPHSISGQNFDIAQCYKTCSAYDIVNGQAKPVSDKVGYPEDCEYYGESTTGNPCDIITIDNKQVCTETSCNYNFELVNGACQPCNREHALSYKHNGNCVVETCATGYHPNGQSCEADTIGCSAPNAESAFQTWIPHANAFGECRITECMTGYHLADNVCQIDTETCRLPHGIGTREWDTQANAWGACVATQCDPGYTSDPSLTDELKTNEHWVQCGRCNNMYNDGELAASSYIQECEIGTCMYQGELYELRNNECNLICDEYCDDTGCRIWNERTGRCEHQCTGGYMPWNDAHGYTAHRD